MRLVKAAAAVLFLLAVAGCASSPPPSGSATPWITAYGCDPLIAMRHGKSC